MRYCLAAFVATVGAAHGHAQAPVTAIAHVNVIPMDRERVLWDQTVLVRGDHIAALGRAQRVAIPAGAVRIDGTGQFLLPGLADMHAHVPGVMRTWREHGLTSPAGVAEAERMLLLYLANGVTTVRLMGYTGPGGLALRERAAKGELLGPRIYVGAGPVDFVPSPDSAVRLAVAAKAAGYDFLKFHGVSGPVFDSAAAATRRVGLPIAGHVPARTPLGIPQALGAGYTSMEHLFGFEDYIRADSVAGRSINGWPSGLRVDRAKLQTIARAVRRAHVWTTPTQLLFEMFRWAPDTLARWPEMRYVADTTLQMWQDNVGMGGYGSDDKYSPTGAAAADSAIATRRMIIQALRDAGAGLLLGTDVGVPFLLPGFAVHRELAALVAAGLTPYEALATGTRNVAAFFDTQDSTGTIAVGKRADLVLLGDNPLADIRHTQAIAGVMLGGRWLSRAELDRLLAPLEGTLFQPPGHE